MKNKYLMGLFVLAIVGLALVYQQSYAKYVKKVDGNASLNMASWEILVNDESILGKNELTNNLTATFPGTDYIKEGVIAPGSIGYFDIIIDPSNADVAFSYEITAESTIKELAPDIIVTGYEINPTEEMNQTELTGADRITGNILLNSETLTVRIYIKWVDDETGTMDNSTDTSVNLNYETLTFDVGIKFTQLNN